MPRDEITGIFTETHGMSDSAEYGIWGNMLYRCRTDTSQQYPGYGARGIYFCESWLKFENFLADMGSRPTKDHSLDRIDPDGPYCKENCRWATAKMQARNRRNSAKIMVEGVAMHIHDYCETFGISREAVKSRMKRGWSHERTISTPVRGYRNANN